MALSFVYRLLRRLFGLLRVHRMGAFSKDAEILVLRHQLAVLRRQGGRPRISRSDRALVALVASLVRRERWRAFRVTPQTVLDWHRRLVRRRWTCPHRRRLRRPGLADETVELICRLARENPTWGYLRIVGELRKLGVPVSKTRCGTRQFTEGSWAEAKRDPGPSPYDTGYDGGDSKDQPGNADDLPLGIGLAKPEHRDIVHYPCPNASVVLEVRDADQSEDDGAQNGRRDPHH